MPLKASFEDLATSQEETHRLHFVPCKIKCQDPLEANVKPYFTDAIKDNEGQLSTSLRGYPLVSSNSNVQSIQLY